MHVSKFRTKKLTAYFRGTPDWSKTGVECFGFLKLDLFRFFIFQEYVR